MRNVNCIHFTDAITTACTIKKKFLFIFIPQCVEWYGKKCDIIEPLKRPTGPPPPPTPTPYRRKS